MPEFYEHLFLKKAGIFMTQKLYYENLYSKEFDAQIISINENSNGNIEIILDKTLFYPSGGGQPCDLGFIDNLEVIDVHEDNENIIHVLKNSHDNIFSQNQIVHGVINWDRRFEFMQQHLGEHIFAGCLYNLHKLHTARMRIEGDNISLDIDIHVDWDLMLESETLANEFIWQNLPVEILYPPLDEIKKSARKLPPENATLPIRIVKINGVDYVPCCGLHVKSTGEVGLIKVTSIENHKGGTRIYLKCGRPAYRWLQSLHNEIRKIESELVCGDSSILEKILILKNQIHDAKIELENIITHFLTPLSENLKLNAEVFNNTKIITHVLKNSSQDEIKHLFRLLTDNDSNCVALIAGENSQGIFLTFGCNRNNKNIDVRNAFKYAISVLNGKGGGSAFCSQGWGNNSNEIQNTLFDAKNILKNNLK